MTQRICAEHSVSRTGFSQIISVSSLNIISHSFMLTSRVLLSTMNYWSIFNIALFVHHSFCQISILFWAVFALKDIRDICNCLINRTDGSVLKLGRIWIWQLIWMKRYRIAYEMLAVASLCRKSTKRLLCERVAKLEYKINSEWRHHVSLAFW